MAQYVSAPYGRYPQNVPQQEYVDVAGKVGEELKGVGALFNNLVQERVKAQEAARRYETEVAQKQKEEDRAVKAEERAADQAKRESEKAARESDKWGLDKALLEDEKTRKTELTKNMGEFRKQIIQHTTQFAEPPPQSKVEFLGAALGVADSPEFKDFMHTLYPGKYQKPSSPKAPPAEKIPDPGLGAEAENLYYEYMKDSSKADTIGNMVFSKIGQAEEENKALILNLNKYEGLKLKLAEASGREKEIIENQIKVFETKMDFPSVSKMIEFNTKRIDDLKKLEELIKSGAMMKSGYSGGTSQAGTSSTNNTPRTINDPVKTTPTEDDWRAWDWAKNNPNDPRAKDIITALLKRFPKEFGGDSGEEEEFE